jgi:hypothetical protein
MRGKPFCRRFFGFVTAALLLASSAGAHDIGTTQVRLTWHGYRAWTALITTAPQMLAFT